MQHTDKDRSMATTDQNGEQNPTLNSPGSQVADYGNPAGGSADGEVEGQLSNAGHQGNSSFPTDKKDGSDNS